MQNILKIGKRLFEGKMAHVFNYSRKLTEDFIISTARKEIIPKSRILDIGAGLVKYKKFFQDCVYKTQDFKQYGDIDFVSDITEIPVLENSFDVIICTEVLEHVPMPNLAIKEFSRILKPGGKLYITSPLSSMIHQAPHHFYSGFSKFWYFKFLNDCGFKNIDISPKKRFFAFYSQETLRAMLFIIKSKEWRYRIFVPFAVLVILVLVPLFFWLDKKNLDKKGPSYEATTGYMVKAEKI